MDFSDFNGNLKFKCIVPAVYILNWVLMVVGPIYFPVYYQYYCAAAWVMMFFKLLILDLNLFVILKRTFDTFKETK